MTKQDLIKECRRLGISYLRKSPKGHYYEQLPKGDLEAAIAAAIAAATTPATTPSSDPTPADPTPPKPCAEGRKHHQATQTESCQAKPKKAPTVEAVTIASRWRAFFSEFSFTPQPRFLNTIAHAETSRQAKDYITGYLRLTVNRDAADVAEKLTSYEGTDLIQRTIRLGQQTPMARINNRLEIFFGEPGTGKTTRAQAEYPGAKVVACTDGTTTDTLFRGFDFEEEFDDAGRSTGSHPVFRPCPLAEAMREGRPVILDEINLLPQECLRGLQTVTDGKPSIVVGTDEITIKEGFKVIGTMNLEVGDQVEGLPPPLVDRAGRIVEAKLSDERLAEIAFA